MRFHEAVTAEELAEFLRSDEGSQEELRLEADAYYDDFDDDEEWFDESDVELVVDAAKTNTSVRTFSIDTKHLDDNVASTTETISLIVRNLRGLESVEFVDSSLVEADHGDPAPMVEVLDKLLGTIIKTEANIKSLSLSGHVSLGVFTKVAERFPLLESLSLTRSSVCSADTTCQHCSTYKNFVTEVALAISRGILHSLRRVSLDVRGMTVHWLSDLGSVATTSLRELHVVASHHRTAAGRERLAEAIARFCAFTQSLHVLKIIGPDESDDPQSVLNVTPMFRFWSRHSISDSIREIHLDRCNLGEYSVELARTLKTLEALRMKRSVGPTALWFLQDLPRLRSFHFTYNDVYDHEWGIDGVAGLVSSRRGFLVNNRDLDKFCETIERPDSSLDDVEIDLVGGYDGDPDEDMSHSPYQRFAASERLLRACRGRLVVNFESLPLHSCYDIVEGLSSLRRDLKELRVRFADCKFSDSHYGRILKAVRRNKTLHVFEFGLDDTDSLTDQRISDICDLVSAKDTLHTLSLVGLGSDGAAKVLERILPILASSTTTTKLRSLQLHGADLTDDWPRLRTPLLSMLEENNRVLAELG